MYGNADPDPNVPSIKMSKSSYNTGETIVVDYSNLPGNSTDWIGLYVKGSSDTSDLTYKYTNGAKNGRMTFSGLTNAGEYEARLYFNDSYNREGSASFTIEGDTTSDWTFIVYGDTRTQNNRHRDVLESISLNSPDYKFIVNVGDIVADGTSTSQWSTWRNAVRDKLGSTGQNSNPPKYMSCPGNHDELGSSSGRNNWQNYLSGQQQYGNSGQYFTFDYQNARFIVLNSDASITGSQLNFLKNVLNKPPKTWLFAIWHHPMYGFGGHSDDSGTRSEWGRLLYDAGCDIIFVGHNHYYARTKKVRITTSSSPSLDSTNGTVQVITGNSGAPLYNVNVGNRGYMVAETYSNYGYTELDVSGNQLRLRHISDGGNVRDLETYRQNKK